MGRESQAAKERPKTNYTVLRKITPEPEVESDTLEQRDAYEVVGTVDALNADAARKHFAEFTDKEGDYVAPPTSSFVPVPVALEHSPRAVIAK